MKLPSLTHASADYTPVEVYCGLRDMILRLPGERAEKGFKGLVGALMESGYDKAVASLVVLADGTTSLYFSNGGGVIGVGPHKPVAVAGAVFLKAAEEQMNLMQKAEEFPLPLRDHSRFYVLTTEGVWTGEGMMNDLGNNRMALSPLFHAAHGVITAIREKTGSVKR